MYNVAMAHPETKTRLLDAAEKLFSERGFVATSLRDVTRAAGTNLAAVNYHFGSRQGLIRALFDRRLGPLNAARLKQLEQCCEGARGELEPMLRALVAPFAELVRESNESGVQFVRLLGRAHFEPDPMLRDLIVESFHEVATRFADALAGSVRHLDRQELYSRLVFSIGVLTVLSDRAMFARFASDPADVAPLDVIVAHMVAFLKAGFEAPATEASKHVAAAAEGQER